MALTRKFLKGLGLNDDQIEAVVEEHTNTTNGIIADRDRYRADAEKLPEARRELDELKNNGDSWKDKYEQEHSAFERFKTDTEAKANLANVEGAYRSLLKSANVGEAQIDAIVKVTNLSELKLNGDGKFENEGALVEGIKKDWAGFIQTTSTQGASVDNPPGGNNGAMTREEFNKMPLSERMKYANAHPGEMAGIYKT